MAISESKRNSEPRNLLSRRAALASTAAIGAAVLPAGVALAATGSIELPDADPGLAQLEAGYRRWQELQGEKERLDALAGELYERAENDRRPMFPPKPERSPEIVEWITEDGAFTRGLDAVPKRLRKRVRAHFGGMINWRHACNDIVEGHPDLVASDKAEAKGEKLGKEADEVRLEVLAIPTRSPRGLLIKLAIAMEARELVEIDDMLANPSRSGVHDGWVSEDLLPALAADLRAMVAGGVA